MSGNSRPVESNQTGPHENLQQTVLKHLNKPYQQPFRPFSEDLFHRADALYKNSNYDLILDSGCGTGESTFNLAQKHPKHLLIGIDKSLNRLQRSGLKDDLFIKNNVILIRADLVDFWRLAEKANWRLAKHYLLYPNPWPKKQQLTRRWHGHAVFPSLIKLGGLLELRTNWKIYADEFVLALETSGQSLNSTETLIASEALSPFEKKYGQSGHDLYRLQIQLK